MSITRSSTIEIPDLSDLSGVSDAELLRLGEVIACGRRQWEVAGATVAAEIARRSTREAGYDGLAQRTGDRTPEALVARNAGVSTNEARAIMRVGGMLEGGSPWLGEVTTAVSRGDVPIGVADAIGRGLGTPDGTVAADDLADAAHRLLVQSGTRPVEQLHRLAREARDELDVAGVADREAALRERRSLRLTRQPDGMTRMFGLLDPESAALVTDAFDQVTSPRRGGPRFVDPTAIARAQAIADDPRTDDQLLLDAFVELVRASATVDTSKVYVPHDPGVRMIVTLDDLQHGTGRAIIEGQHVPVSIETAQRVACATGISPFLFHRGDPLNRGRANRLFTPDQRAALAVKWGGCAIDTCTRPPSWTEAHHIEHWVRDRGRSDIRDGILLCRHHHMLLHNNHWSIDRTHATWRMLPPPGDPVARPHDLIPKHPIPQRR